jgi:hypothetical protein
VSLHATKNNEATRSTMIFFMDKSFMSKVII